MREVAMRDVVILGPIWETSSQETPSKFFLLKSRPLLKNNKPPKGNVGVRASPERRLFSRVREGEGVRHREFPSLQLQVCDRTAGLGPHKQLLGWLLVD